MLIDFGGVFLIFNIMEYFSLMKWFNFVIDNLTKRWGDKSPSYQLQGTPKRRAGLALARWFGWAIILWVGASTASIPCSDAIPRATAGGSPAAASGCYGSFGYSGMYLVWGTSVRGALGPYSEWNPGPNTDLNGYIGYTSSISDGYLNDMGTSYSGDCSEITPHGTNELAALSNHIYCH